MPGPVLDLKPFLPAKDFARASQFYLDLGFTRVWGHADLAAFEVGAFRVLLQYFYEEPWASNFVMHLRVEDAGDRWTHVEAIGLRERYPGIMALQPWGLRVLYPSYPSGVLWHIAGSNP